MSDRPPTDPLEERLREAGARFEYPPTPAIARDVRRRLAAERPRGTLPLSLRRLQAAVAIACALLLLLAVPEVRAGIRALLRIGSVQVVLPTSTPLVPAPTAPPVPTPTMRPAQPTSTPAPPTRTPVPTATPIPSVLDLAGETTLDAARRRVPFKLPTYPPGISPPDRVFVQDFGGPVAALVWLVPGNPSQVRFSLHALTSESFAQKMAGQNTVVKPVTVHGQPALWVRGPHLLEFYQHRTGFGEGREVLGNVLIWTQDGLTYRLEGDDALTMEQAVKIAESLR